MAAAVAARPAFAQSRQIAIGVGSDPVFTPIFVAAHEKLFAAQGLDVVVRPFTDGGTAMDALAAQQVHLASASEPTHLVRLSRADLKPLAVVQQSGRYVKLAARKGLKADQVRKLGIVPGSVNEYVTGLFIKKLGLDPSSLQMVKSGPPEMPALLARGDVDGFFLWEPWPTNALRSGAELIMTSDEVGYKSTLWLTPLGSWLDANRDAAQAVLKAVKQGADIARQDPQRGAAAVQAIIKMPPSTSLPLLKELDSVVRDFNDDDIRTTSGISDFLLQQKMIPAAVDPKRFLQLGFFKG